MEREPARGKPTFSERWPSFLAGLVVCGCLCLILTVVLPEETIAWRIATNASPFTFIFILLGAAFLGGWSIGREQKWIVWVAGGSVWVGLAWFAWIVSTI